MTQAQTFLDRYALINADLTGKDRIAMILNLKADIDVYCRDTNEKRDGSVVYEFDDRSYVRVHGYQITAADKTAFGRSNRKAGRLSL